MDNLNEKMMQNLKFTAIRSLSEECQFNIDANGKVTFLPGSVKFSDKQIKAEMDRLQEVWGSSKYRSQRMSEYPSVGDQLDALFKAGLFPEEMAAKIQAVKDKYPKQ